MKFRYLGLILALLILAFIVQQAVRYLALTQELSELNEQSRRLALLTDKAMYEEASILQQLKKAELRYQYLRSVLPTELQEENVEQHVAQLAKKHQVKVLATKTAINSRPLYREATIAITLEATANQVKQFIKAVQSASRLTHITAPAQLGKKNFHLAITIYAQNPVVSEEFSLPQCVEMPGGLLLPPLQEPLTALYRSYSQHCRFVARYGELYLKQRHLLALQDEITQLDALLIQLGQAK